MDTINTPDFQTRRAAGLRYEQMTERWLLQTGYSVVPTYAIGADPAGISACAPSLLMASGNAILPDMLVSRDGISRWVEIKHFHSPAENRKYGCKTHGTLARYLTAYQRVQQSTGIPVLVVIIESPDGESGQVLRVSLDAIFANQMPCQCTGCARGYPCHGTQIYWRRSIMQLVGRIKKGEIE